jgi:hypothetical protein
VRGASFGLCLALAALTPGCVDAGADAGASAALGELERLAFVPAGSALLEGFSGPRARIGAERALLVDRYELSRRDWAALYPGRPLVLPGGAEEGEPARQSAEWPAPLDRATAEEVAARRGMRLPTSAEWLYAAAGPRALPYPCGASLQASVAATLELGASAPAPVGTFEAGRSPFGCYDVLGNVWEWVSDRVPGIGEQPGEAAPELASSLGSALGGSFLYRARPLYSLPLEGASREPVFLALTLDPRVLRSDVGLRCVADAEEYLWGRCGELGTAAGTAARVRAVGESWGASALVLLEELAARPGAPRALGWLLEGARP